MRWFIYLLLGVACLSSGCGNASSTSAWGGTNKLRVLTSIVPMYCLTAQVAGEDAEVFCLLTTHGPHGYAPTAADVKVLSEANLFVVNGLNLEDFLENMIKNAGNRGLKVLRVGDSLQRDRILKSDGTPHYHGNQLVSHQGDDPHAWLGLDEAILMVDVIRDALIDRDAAHADGYKQRAEATKARLTKLKEQFKDLPASKVGGIITFHDSFRYFARTFKLEIAGTIRDVRGDQPFSPAALRDQAEEFRKKNVRVIGVEPQYPRAIAENLAREMGGQVKIIELDPLETAPTLDGQPYKVDPNYYIERMEKNLQTLRQAFP